MNLTDSTILITGGTSGIGLGLAQRLHAEGNRVIVAGRRTELLAKITAEHPGMVGLTLDVTDPASIAACAAQLTEDFPELNVLINNAGIMVAEDVIDLATSEAIITANLLGPIRMTAALLPLLQAQPTATLMNVSSGLAFVPLAVTPTYSATKAALHSWSEALRVQLADTAIEVVELIPPAVQTDIFGLGDSPMAMPLAAFLDEVMGILRNDPKVREVLVENVKGLRFAEASGSYDQVLAGLNSAH